MALVAHPKRFKRNFLIRRIRSYGTSPERTNIVRATDTADRPPMTRIGFKWMSRSECGHLVQFRMGGMCGGHPPWRSLGIPNTPDGISVVPSTSLEGTPDPAVD